MTTVAITELIQHLDWDHAIICSGRGCEHEGVALVKFRDHVECKAHHLWYVACQTHLDEALAHKTLCHRCGFHLSLLTHKFL